MKKLLLLCTLLFLTTAAHAVPAPAVNELPLGSPWNDVDVWVAENPRGDALIADAARIREINETMRRKESSLIDLESVPESVSGDYVHRYVAAATPAYDTYYTPNIQLTWDGYVKALENRNMASMYGDRAVRYGVTVSRGDLRLLPTSVCWAESPGDTHYDSLQATAVDPSEPVLILTESVDGEFYFILTRCYAGWLKKGDLALTDRAAWLTYVRPEDFSVVTHSRYTPSGEGPAAGEKAEKLHSSRAFYQLGARIKRLADGRYVFPISDGGGNLIEEVFSAAPGSAKALHDGYLPYTEGNIVKMAFRHLGDVYGWGGQDDSVDCSAFVQNVYRTMGIEIPRDADQQERAMLHTISLEGMNHSERLEALRRAPAGSLLFRPGHVMLYLGEASGTPMVIHSLSSYYKDTPQGRVRTKVRQVLVSSALFATRSGATNLDACTSIGWVK
ncbi:SH3 domain-containing protein [Selenomonas sp. TAMA-11512]|uniref:NlpC/P60 family protein n=1 Tax=Selenomonas sp. TAMA-11512 TaxID=3095337 RepID=UPI00308E5C79|nr:SH3 domain-containing protein [Selenomonas sp. TAMA-11512]